VSIVKYRSSLTVDRIKRKNSKDSMARQLFETYHLLHSVVASSCATEIKYKAEELQMRIAWGE